MKLIRMIASAIGLAMWFGFLPAQGLKFVSRTDTPGDAQSVFIDGTTAYVADGIAGLQIIDIGNPANPIVIGKFTTPDSPFASDVVVDKSIAFLTTQKASTAIAGLFVLDVHNPRNPINLHFRQTQNYYGELGIALSGNRLLVSEAGGAPSSLFLFDVTNPQSPALNDVFSLNGETGRIAIHDNTAILAHYDTGVRFFDLSQRSIVRPYLSYITGHVTDVAFFGANVVFGSAEIWDLGSVSTAGIKILELQKQTIIPRANFGTRHDVLGIDAQFPMIIAANGSEGVYALEALSLDEIVQRARFNTPGTARDVVFKPPYIYVADGEAGLTILRYDGPDPEVPSNVAVLAGHTIPSRLLPGETVDASVTYTNLGSVNWTAPNYKLLLRNPSPLWQEITPRVNVPAGTLVRSDNNYTFNFKLKAPVTDGTYSLEFSMIEEFVQSFGTPLKVSVAVGAAAATHWELYQ